MCLLIDVCERVFFYFWKGEELKFYCYSCTLYYHKMSYLCDCRWFLWEKKLMFVQVSVPVLTYVHFLFLFYLWSGLWQYDTRKYYVHVGNASVNPVFLWNVFIRIQLAVVIPKI